MTTEGQRFRAKRAEAAGGEVIIGAPFGAVRIEAEGDRITSIRFLERGVDATSSQSALLKRAAEQVEEYLADPRAAIDLPLAPVGTSFQQRVWRSISAIPVGVTRRYGDLAAELDSVARAVGQACGDNRFPLVIPCHRVVATKGVGGFAHSSGGFLLEVKHWLLRHEALVSLDAR